ncbi:MAG: nucleoside hydrolase, partial [Gaiellaceae bacterium]
LTAPYAEQLRAAGETGRMVAELVDFFVQFHKQTYGFDGAPIHDAVAVAHVIQSGLVEMLERNVQIETVSDLCRGRTVVDLWRRTENEPNAHVGVGIDAEAFLELLVTRVSSFP